MTGQPPPGVLREVVVDGVRYVPAGPYVVDTPDMPDYKGWIPEVGQRVWSNFDSGPPMGVVVGYVKHPGHPRHGQPVIEVEEDESGLFGRKKGTRSIVHPMFVWPFCPGSDEHKQAIAAGRFE